MGVDVRILARLEFTIYKIGLQTKVRKLNLSPGVAQLEEQPTVEYSLRGYRRVIGSIPVPGTKWHL